QRVEAGRAVAILDAGLPPKGPLSKSAHAGLLAFTLFDEGQPLFVNCGGDTDAAQDLPQGALRATAAHSAIALQDTNAAQIRTNGQIGRAGQETCFGRDARGGGEAVVATSDCYARRYGMTISRGLWLRGDGNLILGRDVIRSIAAPKASLSADIRFHVHPDVTVSLTGGGAILRLPNGNWWNLRTDGVEVILEPSVYVAAHDARPRQTQQVVFSLPLEAEENSVRWSLTRG
ncbi:MAG: heparinase II/III-family protein, partial [Pseudomonadota bacterium]